MKQKILEGNLLIAKFMNCYCEGQEPKFDYDLKFTGKLFTGKKIDGLDTANQVAIAEQWLKKKNGLCLIKNMLIRD